MSRLVGKGLSIGVTVGGGGLSVGLIYSLVFGVTYFRLRRWFCYFDERTGFDGLVD